MPELHVYTREFAIVSDTVDSDLVYTDGYRPDGEETAPFEVIDCTPDEYDREDGLTAVDVAARWFEDNGPATWEPDVMPGAASWFIAREDTDEGEEMTACLEGFTPEERAALTPRVLA